MRRIGLVPFVMLALWRIPALAADCDRAFLEKLNSDKALTTLNRETAARKLCLRLDRTVMGTLLDVDQGFLKIRGDDGIEYGVKEVTAATCGELNDLRKGQRITAKGKIETVYGTLYVMHLTGGSCIRGK